MDYAHVICWQRYADYSFLLIRRFKEIN